MVRIKALVPERAKQALPPRVKDALFNGVHRMIVAWDLIRRRDSRFVTSYLGGLKGIEIGAGGHNPYYLDAINVDRYSHDRTVWKDIERRVAGKTAGVDVVAYGDDLPFADDSYDFVFSSHVIEHFADPVKALYEWVRVARRYVVAVAPDQERNTERGELTTVDELIQRHRSGFTSDEDKHWSVWTCESFVEMCHAIGLTVADQQDPDDKVGNGFTVVIDASAGVSHPVSGASSGRSVGVSDRE